MLGDVEPPSTAAIVTSLCFSAADARPNYRAERGGTPFEQYRMQFHLLTSLLRSLALVRTRLKVWTLVTERHAVFEAHLSRLGSTALPVTSSPPRPAWVTNSFFATTWTKLLILELTQFSTVVFLDNDVVALRNIDHLAMVPTPAYAFLPSDAGINSGVAVVKPDAAVATRLRAFVRAQPRRMRCMGGCVRAAPTHRLR